MKKKRSTPTYKLHRSVKIQTACLNQPSPVQACTYEAGFDQSQTPQATLIELEQAWRNRECLSRIAQRYARQRGCDPEDLLSASILRALQRPVWKAGVVKRLEGIISSESSKHARSRHRRRKAGRETASIEEAQRDRYPDTTFPRTLTPHQVSLRNSEMIACAKALDAIAGADPRLEALIDGIGQGLRGDELQQRLGISENALATLRKKLKRRATDMLKPFERDGRIDVDLLALRFQQ